MALVVIVACAPAEQPALQVVEKPTVVPAIEPEVPTVEPTDKITITGESSIDDVGSSIEEIDAVEEDLDDSELEDLDSILEEIENI